MNPIIPEEFRKRVEFVEREFLKRKPSQRNNLDMWRVLANLANQDIKDKDSKTLKHLKMFCRCWYKEIIDEAYEGLIQEKKED